MDIFSSVSSNLLVATLLSIFAWCIGRLTVRPQVRHVLWMMVLLKLVSPPLVSLPVWPSSDRTASNWPRNLSERFEREPNGRRNEDHGFHTNGDYESVESAEIATAETSQLKNNIEWNLLPWRPILVIVWAAGAALAFFLAWRRLVAFGQALSSARPAPEVWTTEVQTIATRLGLRYIPQLLFVEARIPPMVCCVANRSVVVLPSQLMDRLDWSQRRGIIAHELAHLLRGDHWIRWVELVVTGIYWWNPIAWWARAEVHRAEEECCDALVVGAFPVIAIDYAQSLLETVDFLAIGCVQTPRCATTFGGFRPLERRIAMMLDARSERHLSRTWKMLLWTLVVVILPLSVSAAQQNVEEHLEVMPERPEEAGRPTTANALSTGTPAAIRIDEVVTALRSATQRLRGFSVEYEIAAARCFETDKHGRMTALPSDKWVTERILYRHLFSRQEDGNPPLQRVDVLNPENEAVPLSKRSFDGDVRRSWYPGEGSGLVGNAPDRNHRFFSQGHDYLDYLGHSFHRIGIEENFSIGDAELSSDKEGRVVLHSPPRFTTVPGNGYRLWLDPNRGMALFRFVRYQIIPRELNGVKLGGDGKEHIADDIVIEDSSEISPGVWVPIRATRTLSVSRGRRVGEKNYLLVLSLSPGKCRWNPPLNQRDFAFDFPPGTKVHNELLRADIVVGR